MNLAFAVPPSVLKGARKAVFIVLCDHAHEDGSNVFPSQGTIAYEAGVERLTVHRLLRELEASGFIERRPRKRLRGVIEYRIKVEALKWQRGKGPAHRHVTEDHKSDGSESVSTCDAGSQVPVTEDHTYLCSTITSTCDAGSHKPSVEPSFEPSRDPEREALSPARVKERWHRNHVFCTERICLTAQQSEQLARSLPEKWGSLEYRTQLIVSLAKTYAERIDKSIFIDANPLKWWDGWFNEVGSIDAFHEHRRRRDAQYAEASGF